MKKCRFNDPYFISLYHDGALDKETEKMFSEHLITCQKCTGALMNLERDLFFMNTMKFSEVPAYLEKRGAVFKLIADGIRLIKNLTGQNVFVPVQALAVRGDEKYLYRFKTEDIKVDIRSEGGDIFTADISGISGMSISLYREERLVEARAHITESKLVIQNLERGSYSLLVDDNGIVEFIVE